MRSLVPPVRPSQVAGRERPSPRAPSWRDALAFVRACIARREQRLDLAELTGDQLTDIGLSRSDVECERRRWPWDGPAQDA